jgi:flagellar hook-associated protein 3 FlgL
MSDMRVATNSIQEGLIRQLNNNQRTLVDLQKQLSTGRRVSLPEDDPIVVGRTIRRQSEKTMLAQYSTNNTLALGVVNSSQLHLDQLRKLSDLALGIVNSTGASTSSVEIDGFKRQLDEVLNQALDMANAQQDGEYLFAGVDYSGDPYTIDDGGTPADPSDDTIAYNGSPTDRSDPNFDEAETFIGKNSKLAARLNPEHNEDIQYMLQNLLSLRNSYDTGIAPFDAAVVRSIAANIEEADDRLVVAGTDLLTKQMRLSISAESDSSYYAQLDESIATEVEADMTDLAVRLKQTELSYQAALASSSRILNLSLLNYL